MDEARKIRFVHPPVIFAAALVSAAALDPNVDILRRLAQVRQFESGFVASLAAAVAVVLLTLGFVFGTITVFILHVFSRIRFRSYEDVIPTQRRADAWRKIGGEDTPVRHSGEYLSAALDHGVIDPGYRQWIERRWNAMNVCSHSVCAIFSSILVTNLSGLDPGGWYFAVLIGLGIAFLVCAVAAWNDTLRMNDLILDLPKPSSQSSSPKIESD